MARILFGNVPAQGHISPTIAIAAELQKQGHTVAYACHPCMQRIFKRTGISLLENFRWGDLLWEVSNIKAVNRVKSALHLLKETRGAPHKLFIHKLEEGTSDFLNVLDSWKPDVCVCDMIFLPGMIAAEARGIPFATSCAGVFPLQGEDLPPYGPGYPPDMKSAGKANVLFHELERFVIRSNLKVINRVRGIYHLSPVKEILFYPSPYLYLAYTTEAFEYSRAAFPSQVFFVGPSLTDNRGDFDDDFPWDWFDGRPVVYFSMGTIYTKKSIFDKVIEASRGAPWKLVASTSRHLEPAIWKDLPENVLIRKYVPQPVLLRKVNAVISHGGNNTVTETLAAGIPLAVLPQGVDQFEAAQRVVEAGAGLRLNPWQVSLKSLQQAVRQLLTVPLYRQNAERVAADYALCNGPATAAALICRLAAEGMPLHRPPGTGPTVYSSQLENLLERF